MLADPQLGVAVRHCVRVSSGRDRGLLFACRSQGEKIRWLEALTEERRLVAQDLQEGLEFDTAARQLARMTARCQRQRPPSKPRGREQIIVNKIEFIIMLIKFTFTIKKICSSSIKINVESSS